jgi:Domain of unknown function (DUF6457)
MTSADPGSDWIDRLAVTLGEVPLDGPATNRILSVARDVAHTVERRITPLSTFLVGAAVGRRAAGGVPRDRALDAVLELVVSTLPEPGDDAEPAG